MFLYHYGQQIVGSSRPKASDLPLNILKRGTITYYSVNFEQHRLTVIVAFSSDGQKQITS